MRYVQEAKSTLTNGKYSHYLVQITRRGSYGNLTYIVKRILHSGKADKYKIFEYASGDVIFQPNDFVKAVKLAFELPSDEEAIRLLPYIAVSSLIKFDELANLFKKEGE